MGMPPLDLVRAANEEKSYTEHFVMLPSRWTAFAAVSQPALAWSIARFDDTSASTIPPGSGIYAFVVQSGVAPPLASWCLYVGKSKGLRKRYLQYRRERASTTGRPKIVYRLNLWPDHMYFWYASVPAADITWVENALIRALTPPGNDDVPADIRAPHAAF